MQISKQFGPIILDLRKYKVIILGVNVLAQRVHTLFIYIYAQILDQNATKTRIGSLLGHLTWNVN